MEKVEFQLNLVAVLSTCGSDGSCNQSSNIRMSGVTENVVAKQTLLTLFLLSLKSTI